MKIHGEFLNRMLMDEADGGEGMGGAGASGGVDYAAQIAKLTQENDSLKQDRDKLSGNNKKLLDEKVRIQEKYSGVDLDSYNKIMNDNKNEELLKVMQEGGIEAFKNQYQTEIKTEFENQYKETINQYQTEIDGYKSKYTEKETAYNNLLTNLEINKAVNELSDVMQSNVSEFLKPIVDAMFTFDESGNLVHKEGKRNHDGEPMSPKDLFESKEFVEKYPFLYKGKSGTGGMANGSGGFNGASMTQEQVDAELRNTPPHLRVAKMKELRDKGLIK